MIKQKDIKLALASFAIAFIVGLPAAAEDSLDGLAGTTVQAQPVQIGVSKTELDANISQLKSEVRSQRDLTELRVSVLENEIEQSAAYVERLLFAFMLAGGIVVFVVLVTLNKQTGVNNEKMRNLIRESEHALTDLHRMLDRPEAEHFHVSRKLSRVMNKMREHHHVALPQKDISDIYAAAEDPTLPVTLHLQANALKKEQGGDFHDAILLWQKLLEVDNSNPEVLLHLAQNYKKLSEISTGHHIADFRKASLEYFQEYAVRTSTHMSAAHELQQRIGDTKLPEPLEAKQPVAVQQQPQTAKQQLVKPAKPQLRNTAATLLESSKSKFSSVKKNPVAAAAFKAVSNVAIQVSELSSSTSSQEKAIQPASTEPETIEATAQELDVSQAGNGNGKSIVEVDQNQVVEVERENSPAAEIVTKAPVKVAKHQPAKKTVARKKPTPKKLAPASNSSNGKPAAATAQDQPLSEEERKLAFASRIDKAKDYFRRFGAAKQSEQLKWLQAALDELQTAEKYQQNINLYQLWGITLLEISRQDQNNPEEVRKALDVFSKGEKISEGSLCNEIALCYAILQEENNCRDALKKAIGTGKLNTEIFMDQPEFVAYQTIPWFQEILAEAG